MTTLWIFDETSPRTIELCDQVVTIGRGKSNSLQIKDPTISKRHARLIRNQKGWWIEDVGSVNGTWIDDQRVTRLQRLSVGVRFRLGKHEFGLDDSEMANDSPEELAECGAILQTLPAIPVIEEAGDGDEAQTVPIHEDSGVAQAVGRAAQNALASRSIVIPNASSGETLEEKKLRLIRAVGEAVIQETELSNVANEILVSLVEEIQADRAFLCLFAEGTVVGLPIASYGVSPGEKVVFSRTVCKEMLDNRAGVLIQKGGDGAAVSASLAEMEISSTICVPLWTKDRIMGFMSMDITQTQRQFTTVDLELLISVSHQVAIAVERARLSELATRERQRRDYLCQYLDHKIVHSVLNSAGEEDPLAPHEQTVTTMFCDIASFTKLSENMAPTDLAKFVQEHFTAMTEILFSYNGTVDKYIGDAVMALFGAPVADDKAPLYAVQAAVAMRKFAESTSNPRVRLRFGIASGSAVVGNIGSAQRREYTAIGDPVNVASRLEMFARPGEIVVDEETAKSLGAHFLLNDIGDIDVRNRQEPVRVFQVEPMP